MNVDRTWSIVALLALAALAGAVAVPAQPPAVPDDAGPTLVDLRDGSRLWPHTSRGRSFERRTLAMNVLVYAGPTVPRRALTSGGTADWDRVEARRSPDVVGFVPWKDAHGARRYTYVERTGGDGRWLGERYQLDAGDYLGTRRHVRAYAVDGADWTAMQAHGEYWDWFRLRHTVDDVDESRERVVAGLQRDTDADVVAGVDGVRSTAVGLVAGLALWVPVYRRSLRPLRPLVPALAVGGTYLAVRVFGVGIERAIPLLPPKAIAAALYPVLAVGIPAIGYAAGSREGGARRAFAGAAGGLAAAFVVEAAALGLTPVAPSVALHRLSLVLAVGVVAAGAAEIDGDGPHPALGVAVWVSALAASLAGLA